MHSFPDDSPCPVSTVEDGVGCVCGKVHLYGTNYFANLKHFSVIFYFWFSCGRVVYARSV